MRGFPGGSDRKESACSVGDLGSIPGSGRSPGEGDSNPLQYSCLENPMEEEPRKSHGWGSLACYSLWGRRVGHDWATSFSLLSLDEGQEKRSTMTENTHTCLFLRQHKNTLYFIQHSKYCISWSKWADHVFQLLLCSYNMVSIFLEAC